MRRVSFEEALMAIPGAGPVMQVAREVSRILREQKIDGPVIGGVAVVLHGHTRTTVDVDLYAPQPRELGDALTAAGFVLEAAEEQFVKDRVPVHLVPASQIGIVPQKRIEIDGVTTISLADLINIKLRSGRDNVLRAKDLGDVIDLIRHHRLRKDFLPRIDTSVRKEFERLVDAIERDQQS